MSRARGPNGQFLKSTPEKVTNGLAEAVGMTGYPFNQGVPGTAPVEQTGPLLLNLRYNLVSNMRQILSQAYAEIGLVKIICDLPVDDALRGGVTFKSRQLSEDQLMHLTRRMKREADVRKVGQAAKWNRLFGGAGILVLTDQDPLQPLEVSAIGKDDPLEFRPVDMWELFWDQQNTEGYDPTTQEHGFDFYSYYGEKIHKSRVMRMKGLEAPSFIRPRLRGWGLSVVEILVRSINQYLKGTNVAYEVMDEFKVDYYKIKDLISTLLMPGGAEKVFQRVKIANFQKNFQNAVVMDQEDEWDHKQLSFTGIAEAMAGVRMQVASDMRMPLTRLFGISASGFNSGEDDIEVYNSMVEGEVREKIEFDLLKVAELRCQQLFGLVPDDLEMEFQPLRVLSAVDEETVKTQKFTRALQAQQAGLITADEFRDSCNRGDLLPITLEQLTPDMVADLEATRAGTDETGEDSGGGGGDEEGERQEDGANAPDSAKPRKPASGKAPKPEDGAAKTPKRNSAAFDRAAYEADGGDAMIDPRRKEFFENPGNVDEALWEKAKEASQKEYGKVKWQFVVFLYKKWGGTFS